MILQGIKLTQEQALKMMVPLEQDLIAYYKLQEEAVIKLTDRAVKYGWRPEELIRQIELLFEDTEDGAMEKVDRLIRDLTGKEEVKNG